MQSYAGNVWCPSCGAEYRPGFTHCPDCDVDLVADEPVLEPAGLNRDEPQLVDVFAGPREDAEAVKGLLARRGIPSAMGERPDPDASGPAHVVVVRAEQVPVVLEILETEEWDSLRLDPGDPEYDEGIPLDDPLEDEVGPDGEVDLGSDPTEVWAGSGVDAEMIRSLLAGNGIVSDVWGTGAPEIPEIGDVVSARLMTRLEDARRAAEIIEAAESGELALDEEEDVAATGREFDSRAGAQPSPITEVVPWFGRPWGRVILGGIVLLVVAAIVLSTMD